MDDDRAWLAYWEAQHQPWRTEPEIDVGRQQYLEEHLTVKEREWERYPFKDIVLDRADVEWLLANYADGRRFAEQSYQLLHKRSGLDLRGVDLRKVDLHGLPLQGVDLYNAHLEGTDLREVHLERANLSAAYLQDAYLYNATRRTPTSARLTWKALTSEQPISKALTSARLTWKERTSREPTWKALTSEQPISKALTSARLTWREVI
jgi:hypothetical protein